MTLTLPFILASASPRRAALLAQVGLEHRVLASGAEEPPPAAGEDILAWAQRAALDKARATAVQLSDLSPSLILGADTVVVLPVAPSPAAPVLHGRPVQVLGKPEDAAMARRMLQRLSGAAHTVVSAFALLTHPAGEAVTDAVETTVQFRTLTDAEIDWYIAGGEPLDKAGAYGIQGAGAVLVERITGDYFNVVGLPLARLWEHLASWRRL